MTRRRGPLRAVFLDAGGTLFRPFPSVGAVYAEVLAGLGRRLDPDRLEERFAARWGDAAGSTPPGVDRFRAAPGGERGFWRALVGGVLADLGETGVTAAELDAVYGALSAGRRYRMYPDVPGALAALRDAPVVLGVISNWDSRLPALLDELGLGGTFTVVVASGVDGVEKPAREAFELACRRAGVAPGEALHVGDSAHDDLEGARAASLDALLLDREGRARGAHVVRDLVEAAERVAAVNGSWEEAS